MSIQTAARSVAKALVELNPTGNPEEHLKAVKLASKEFNKALQGETAKAIARLYRGASPNELAALRHHGFTGTSATRIQFENYMWAFDHEKCPVVGERKKDGSYKPGCPVFGRRPKSELEAEEEE